MVFIHTAMYGRQSTHGLHGLSMCNECYSCFFTDVMYYTSCGCNIHSLSIYIYTLGKKGCYTPIEDNKTNVDRTFVFPLGCNWHDMDPWLFPNEIRHYLGQTFNARSSGIVELRNHSKGGRSPKSIFTLWQLWINICIFFSKVFLIVWTMPRPTPMGIRHEVFTLAREGIKQGAIAARVGLTCATFNRILKRHAATGSLVPGKSSGAPRKTTPRQDRALLRMVRQDRFFSARALTARMRNLYGMRAGRTRVNNRLLSHGYLAYRPTTKPLLTSNHRPLRLEWAQRWRNLTVAHWQHVIFGDESRFQLYPVDGRLRVHHLPDTLDFPATTILDSSRHGSNVLWSQWRQYIRITLSSRPDE